MRCLLVLLCCVFVLSSCQPPSATPPGPPNIVLIFADDLGYGDLSSYGHPTIHTPRLDRMAQEGIKLTSFYVAAPVCTPSRAALMTGRFPIRLGMPGNQGPDSQGGMPADEQTLAEALKAQGYRTAAFGKWHLGSTPGFFPTDHGFDEYFGLLYSNDMIPPWVNTERPLHLYRNATPTDEQPVDQRTLTKRYTEEAVRVIRDAQGQPFFIYLPHSMPHLPVYASEERTGRSKGGRYGDVIEELDWSTGRFLDVLAEEGLDLWPMLTQQEASPHDYYYYFWINRLEAIREAGGPLATASLDNVRIVRDRSRGATTRVVNGLSHHFFASAGLAQ